MVSPVPRLSVCFVLLVMTLPALPAAARMRGARPINVRMQLYVGAAPAGVNPQFSWRVADRKNERDLQLTTLSVFGGNATALDLDAAVKPYKIKFRLAGDPDAIRRLIDAPAGQLLDVRGIARFEGGARYLMLDAVSPATPPMPPG
jgi:hypothetical protein